MPSIIHGFEYDIFISYRHNDNLDGWVTSFVEHLQKELRATIKEPISLYFDTNPHDGLSAHHDVDDSLREKLKCLIFIPIVSRTYCDTNSFAWKNEFQVFVDQSRNDRFGLKVKLPNGNVASRVLPLRIHDIDKDDTTLFESVTGSVMRPIDLIYKSAGVNRPLSESDKREESNNHTVYRDQINMVANAIDEILKAMKGVKASEQDAHPVSNTTDAQFPSKNKRKQYAIGAALILVSALIFYITFFRTPSLKEAAETGLAVLPFRNNTGDEALNYYGVGMASEIRTKLSMSKQFGFLSALQATMSYNNTNKSPEEIGSELGVDYLLTGIYQKSGIKIKVDVELLDAATGKVVWALPIEKEEADIFQVQADIAQKVLAKFYSFQQQPDNALPTTNLEAYAHYINGVGLFEKIYNVAEQQDQLAIEQFEHAIQLDSSFQEAGLMLVEARAFQYLNRSNDSLTRKKIEKYIAYADKHFSDSWQWNLMHGTYEYRVTHHYDKASQYISHVLELDPDNQMALQLMSYIHKRKLEYGKALELKRKILEINPKLGGEYDDLADVLKLMGDYKNAWHARLKSEQLGWGQGRFGPKSFALADDAVAAGLPLDSIPGGYKDFLGERFELWSLEQQREWRKVIPLAKRLKEYHAVCLAYQLLNQPDSVMFYAKLGLASKTNWTALYYAFMGDTQKALVANTKGFGTRLDTNDDKMFQCFKLIEESILLGLAGDYPEAVIRIQELNRSYPDFSDYNEPLHGPYFEKIRREYPPFLKAVNERTQKPMLDIQQIIKF
jgi:TolB-like protein